jgi:hypothetical protein
MGPYTEKVTAKASKSKRVKPLLPKGDPSSDAARRAAKSKRNKVASNKIPRTMDKGKQTRVAKRGEAGKVSPQVPKKVVKQKPVSRGGIRKVAKATKKTVVKKIPAPPPPDTQQVSKATRGLARFVKNIKRARGPGLGAVIIGGLAALHKHIKGEPSKKRSAKQRIVAEMQNETPPVSVIPKGVVPPIAGVTKPESKPKRKDIYSKIFTPPKSKSKLGTQESTAPIWKAPRPDLSEPGASSLRSKQAVSSSKAPVAKKKVIKDFDTSMGVYGWSNLTKSFGYLGTEKEVGKHGASTYFTEGYRRGSKKNKKK